MSKTIPSLDLKMAYYEKPGKGMCSISVVFFLNRGHADYEFILQLMNVNGEAFGHFDRTIQSRIDNMAGKITYYTRGRSAVLTLTVPSIRCHDAFSLLMNMIFDTTRIQCQDTIDTQKMLYTERQSHFAKNRSNLLQYGTCTPWLAGATVDHTQLVWRHLVTHTGIGVVVSGKWHGDMKMPLEMLCQRRQQCRVANSSLSGCSVEVIPYKDPEELYCTDIMDVREGDATCSVCINFLIPGVRHGTKEFYSLHILSSIIGESHTSKINRRIEDCRSYARVAETSIIHSYESSDTHFVVTAVMDSSVYAKTASSLESSVRAVFKSITAKDVRAHVDRKISWLTASVDDMHEHSRFDCEMFIDDHHDSLHTIIEKLNSIRMMDVMAAAKRLQHATKCMSVRSY